jgi:CheY-like chemotaxis protein
MVPARITAVDRRRAGVGRRPLSRTLYDIARMLESAEASGDRVRRVLELLHEAVPYEQCALLEAQPGEPQRILVTPRAPAAEEARLRDALDEILVRLVVEREHPQPRRARPTRSAALLAVPLVGHGTVNGVLAARLGVGASIDRHLRVLAIVGGQLAAYLSSMRAHDRLDELLAPPPAPVARVLDGIRVLLVDDDSDIRDAFQSVLEHFGAAVTAVGSAAEALATIDDSPPDVLLSDLAMPGENGYDLMRQVAARNAALPAAALTAFGEVADREVALAAGFRMQLGKPIDAVALVAAVAELAGRPVG